MMLAFEDVGTFLLAEFLEAGGSFAEGGRGEEVCVAEVAVVEHEEEVEEFAGVPEFDLFVEEVGDLLEYAGAFGGFDVVEGGVVEELGLEEGCGGGHTEDLGYGVDAGGGVRVEGEVGVAVGFDLCGGAIAHQEILLGRGQSGYRRYQFRTEIGGFWQIRRAFGQCGVLFQTVLYFDWSFHFVEYQ